jgi:hypothetical protein
MTISQLLRKISKLKGEVQMQRERASSATVYNEKEPPAFGFNDSYAAAEKAVEELIVLEATLRQTNAATIISRDPLLGGTLSLSEATCRLQELKSRIAWLKTLSVQAAEKRDVETVEYDTLAGQRLKVMNVVLCPFPEAKRAVALKEAQDVFDTLNDLVETANHQTMVKL